MLWRSDQGRDLLRLLLRKEVGTNVGFRRVLLLAAGLVLLPAVSSGQT